MPIDTQAEHGRSIDPSDVQTRDRHRLGQQLKRAHSAEQRRQVQQKIAASAEKTRARLTARGPIELADGLPVSQRAEEIADAVRDNQVVIVCGETGSGKTTQLPKILMQAGLGARGVIGHTQPRRLAARSVGQRIADELGASFGDLVGFKTRFDAKVSDATQVKLMTDGIMLAETARDHFLDQYDAIIIDEAHERTLNIDFLLGYIKRLLKKRPDLKLIVTSATIDPERFAKFFGDAPIINVEGRGYPVTMRYRPQEDNTDTPVAIEQAARELWREGPGDILVFLPGERDIRDAERHLSKALVSGKHAGAEIIPLYARLTKSAQHRVFTPGNGRRIVLATNVAETSLTVPGIHYVIDTGLARISRYSTAARVQRLPIEPVSQASCNQRAGRCGRIAPGTCIRLFGEDDYNDRPAFTDPEIQRTNLANVLLTMADLRLGSIDDFPFIDSPQSRYIKDGRNLLTQLQALRSGKTDKRGRGRDERITRLGQRLARLPLDPRIGRMLIAGDDLGLLPALRVICAGLTIQDPRERPAAAREAADAAHKPFTDEQSDFVSLLKLWDAFARVRRERSGNQLRKWCREHFLNFMRMREWEDLVRQLRRIGTQVGLSKQTRTGRLADCDYARLHQALLPGLLDQFGRLDDSGKTDKGTYLGARNRKFRIFPGSGVKKKTPRWVVAGELIETSQLFAHTVAMIEPDWLEAAAAHLLKHEYYEPHWSKRRGHTSARLRVKLFGHTLSEGRKIDFGRIEPDTAREIFIRDGLVAGAVTDNRGRMPAFLAHNQRVADDIANREARFRRRDLLVDDTTRIAFYDERLPADVRDRKTLHKWVHEYGDTRLRFDEDSLLRHSGVSLPENDFPETLRLGQTPLALTYRFEPGQPDDGVTLRLPLPAINQFSDERAAWLVPGLLEEKLREMLKALPKTWRRAVVPVPDFARALAERLPFAEGRLEDQVREAIEAMTGLELPADAWQGFAPTTHLQMRFEIINEQGAVLEAGRDLSELRDVLGDRAAASVQDLGTPEAQQTGLTDWPDIDLAESTTLTHGGVTLQVMPALIDRGDSVDLQLVDDPDKAERWHRQGVIRLLRLRLHKQVRQVKRNLDGLKPLAALGLTDVPDNMPMDADIIASLQHDPEPMLLADILHAVIAAHLPDTPRDQAAFEARVAELESHLMADAAALWHQLKPAMITWTSIRKRLKKGMALDAMPVVEDINTQLDGLIFDGFVSQLRHPINAAGHIQRYLKAVEWRLDKLATDGARADKPRLKEIQPWLAKYDKHATEAARKGQWPETLVDLRWLIEEYRVQVFAQPLGTAVKVSPKRLQAAVEAL